MSTQKIKGAFERAKDWWLKRSSSERAGYIKTVAVSAVFITLIGFYYMDKGDEKPIKPSTPKAESIIADDFLDRDIDARIEDQVRKEVERRLKTMGEAPQANTDDSIEALGLSDAGSVTNPDDMDDLDSLQFGNVSYPDANFTPAPDVKPEEEVIAFIGGISSEKTFVPPPPEKKPEPSNRIPIPIGFMPATMLVGVHAQVSHNGSGNPKPIHLRVQAPATLPNKIKMNLAGCFVIANTWGNLASERIEAETVSMACMTSDKKTLIEGKLTGYTADADGQRDIAGRVVTKAGALIGRQVVADIFAGIGESVSQNTGDIAVSPLGTVSTLTGKEMMQRGAASGVGGGFTHAAEFISDLIAQSGPIIESGAAREVMIMVQETSWLEIKDISGDQPQRIN